MDIALLEARVDADACEFDVTAPGESTPLLTLVLAGPTHPNMLAIKRRGEKKLAGAVRRGRDFSKALSGEITEVLEDEELALERQVERLMAGTLDWRGVTKGGEPLPYDKALMEKYYRSKQWLRDAVGAELSRAENFTRSSATD